MLFWNQIELCCCLDSKRYAAAGESRRGMQRLLSSGSFSCLRPGGSATFRRTRMMKASFGRGSAGAIEALQVAWLE